MQVMRKRSFSDVKMVGLLEKKHIFWPKHKPILIILAYFNLA
jgi:hypothetical protein